MLLAIDVGNTHTVFGVHDGDAWVSTWRRGTEVEDTADEIAAWLSALFALDGLPFAAGRVVIGSVVPGYNAALAELASRYFGVEARFLSGDSPHGVPVLYDPPSAVGADRIANALAALALAPPPIVVVDFGTATTFDVVDVQGAYVGGAILAGPLTALQSLIGRAAKLPSIELKTPARALGRNTVESIQSGAMFGTAGRDRGPRPPDRRRARRKAYGDRHGWPRGNLRPAVPEHRAGGADAHARGTAPLRQRTGGRGQEPGARQPPLLNPISCDLLPQKRASAPRYRRVGRVGVWRPPPPVPAASPRRMR